MRNVSWTPKENELGVAPMWLGLCMGTSTTKRGESWVRGASSSCLSCGQQENPVNGNHTALGEETSVLLLLIQTHVQQRAQRVITWASHVSREPPRYYMQETARRVQIGVRYGPALEELVMSMSRGFRQEDILAKKATHERYTTSIARALKTSEGFPKKVRSRGPDGRERKQWQILSRGRSEGVSRSDNNYFWCSEFTRTSRRPGPTFLQWRYSHRRSGHRHKCLKVLFLLLGFQFVWFDLSLPCGRVAGWVRWLLSEGRGRAVEETSEHTE